MISGTLRRSGKITRVPFQSGPKIQFQFIANVVYFIIVFTCTNLIIRYAHEVLSILYPDCTMQIGQYLLDIQ